MKKSVLEVAPFSGVPDYAFTPGFIGDITTAHGHTLSCKMTPERIGIEDSSLLDPENEPYFLFRARVMDEGEGPVMDFMVRTLLEDTGERHPDLRATALFSQSVAYFDTQEPLRGIQGNWIGGIQNLQTNYDQFYKALGQAPHPSIEMQRRAAFSTWTGRQALKHNFTDATPTIDPYIGVQVLFRRPAGASGGKAL